MPWNLKWKLLVLPAIADRSINAKIIFMPNTIHPVIKMRESLVETRATPPRSRFHNLSKRGEIFKCLCWIVPRFSSKCGVAKQNFDAWRLAQSAAAEAKTKVRKGPSRRTWPWEIKYAHEIHSSIIWNINIILSNEPVVFGGERVGKLGWVARVMPSMVHPKCLLR